MCFFFFPVQLAVIIAKGRQRRCTLERHAPYRWEWPRRRDLIVWFHRKTEELNSTFVRLCDAVGSPVPTTTLNAKSMFPPAAVLRNAPFPNRTISRERQNFFVMYGSLLRTDMFPPLVFSIHKFNLCNFKADGRTHTHGLRQKLRRTFSVCRGGEVVPACPTDGWPFSSRRDPFSSLYNTPRGRPPLPTHSRLLLLCECAVLSLRSGWEDASRRLDCAPAEVVPVSHLWATVPSVCAASGRASRR